MAVTIRVRWCNRHVTDVALGRFAGLSLSQLNKTPSGLRFPGLRRCLGQGSDRRKRASRYSTWGSGLQYNFN